jgi:DNA polymerase Ligase (LigD)
MPRFVVLEHDHPSLHWDLMLEAGAALQTWRLQAPPAPGPAREVERSPDHRKLYLDYQGPVGGGRGQVARWDQGTFTWQAREEGLVVVSLAGQRLRGLLRLEQLPDTSWHVSFTPE